MTARQKQVLDFIRQFVADRHYAPTYEEIRVGCEMSTKSLVDYHLNALEAAGYLTRVPFSPRCIVLLEQGAAA
jgi:repressor LexA